MSRGHSIVFGSGSGQYGNIMWEWWGVSGDINLFLNRDWVIWCRAGGLRGGVFVSLWWVKKVFWVCGGEGGEFGISKMPAYNIYRILDPHA